MNKIKIFVSHSSKDKNIGGYIKKCFEECVGFDVFFSSSDLWGSDDFHKEIFNNLDECDLFIPLISSHLKASYFANQEIGLSLGRNKNILPISVDGTKPYGLIDHIHCEACPSDDQESIIDVVSHIFALFIQHKKYIHLRIKALDSLLIALGDSTSFITTSIVLNILIKPINM